MKMIQYLLSLTLVLFLVSFGFPAEDKNKPRVALVEFHEEMNSAEMQWKPSDFVKRIQKAIEKSGKFVVVDRKKVEKIEDAKEYFGRMTPEQETQIKDLGADYIVYASIKNSRGVITVTTSRAAVMIGLTIVNLKASKSSEEILAAGQSQGQGIDGELDYGDRDFKRRNELERVLEDAGKSAVKKAAEELTKYDWDSKG
jgi:curli biogenesis system outer membrane secretion channel CsgG